MHFKGHCPRAPELAGDSQKSAMKPLEFLRLYFLLAESFPDAKPAVSKHWRFEVNQDYGLSTAIWDVFTIFLVKPQILFIKKLQAIYLMLYKRYKTAKIKKYKHEHYALA